MPGAKPLVPTGAPGSVPSEEVTPSGGMPVPTWPNAGPQHNSVVATINNGFIGILHSSARNTWAIGRRHRSRQGSGSDGVHFMAVGKG
jgi:hypothetical protein